VLSVVFCIGTLQMSQNYVDQRARRGIMLDYSTFIDDQSQYLLLFVSRFNNHCKRKKMYYYCNVEKLLLYCFYIYVDYCLVILGNVFN